MEIITTLDNFNIDNYPTGVALGNFDGVHIAHQTLIVNLVNICRENNFKSIIYTFKDHPRRITTENGAPKKIVSNLQKFKILSEMGIDYLVFIDFDEHQRTIEPDQFIKSILIDKLKMAHAVVGFDYRFGYQAKGDIVLLKELSRKFPYNTTIIDQVKIQDESISSTGIRKLIYSGNINKANLFLGRQYSIMGEVIEGKGLGKKFGFPTANISIGKDIVLPKPGVYFTKCIYSRKIYHSITSVGFNPTIGTNPVSVETHIFDFNEDIYGQNIEVLFYHRHRDEIKFQSVEKLIAQVNSDINFTKTFFSI